jgi:MFS family permease
VNENIFSGAGLTDISWAGTIGAGSVFITGPFQSSMIRQFGTRPIIATGIVISACGLILASFVTKVWQLYLTQVSKARMGGFFLVQGKSCWVVYIYFIFFEMKMERRCER